MSEDRQATSDGRTGDRRGTDRRRLERRAPPPVWRRPWAYVSYGVLGALVLVLFFRGLSGGDEPDQPQGPLGSVPTPPREVVQPDARAKNAPPEAAYGAQDLERLVLEGEAALGKRVRAELFCEAPTTVAVTDPERVPAAVAALAVGGRVPAAECKWGRQNDARREDFLLLVPPELAAAFSNTPLTNDDFVRRRHLVAEVEWLGRAQALSLRTAGVLRAIATS